MEWLNYHHLLYFWVVAKEGSIMRASKELRLAAPTISAQIHQLEQDLDQKLFARSGRGLVLTDAGRLAFRYADEIFSLGHDLLDAVKGREKARKVRLVVGVSDVLAKSIVHRILQPAFRLGEGMRIICREQRSLDAFMAELATQAVDVVLSDTPAGSGTPVRAYSHALGECGTSFLAARRLATTCRSRPFPASLDGVPFLVPTSDSTFRGALDRWFEGKHIRPNIVAELDDAALMNVFAEAEIGVVAAPDVIEKEIRQRHKVHVVGRTKEIRQRFFAISIERKIKHPAVAAICDAARRHIFA